jgi:hypothetical protein
MSAYRSQRLQPRRRSPSALLIVLVVLAALAAGFVIGNMFNGEGVAQDSPSSGASGAGGSTAASGSTSASGSPASGASDGAAATPVVAAPEGIIPPGSVARALADGLRIRHEPSTDATLIDELPSGQLVAVGFAPGAGSWGPVDAGGFAWYPVRRLGDLTELPALPGGVFELEGEFGWAAAGDESGPYLELVPPRCPTRPVDLATLEAMQPWEQLACFGDEQLTIEGAFGCVGCGGEFVGTFEPSWLANPTNLNLLSVDPSVRLGPFAVRFPPTEIEPPEPGSIVRITGHFDDAEAAGCTVAPGDPPAPVNAQTAELYCREQFVVESIEVTGTDPDFPSG